MRGSDANYPLAYRTIPGTVELGESSGKAGGFQTDEEHAGSGTVRSSAWGERAREQSDPTLFDSFAARQQSRPTKIHLDKGGIRIAKDAQEEEFCLAYACNHLAKDGWEPVNLNSRRVLLRRAVNR